MPAKFGKTLPENIKKQKVPAKFGRSNLEDSETAVSNNPLAAGNEQHKTALVFGGGDWVDLGSRSQSAGAAQSAAKFNPQTVNLQPASAAKFNPQNSNKSNATPPLDFSKLNPSAQEFTPAPLALQGGNCSTHGNASYHANYGHGRNLGAKNHCAGKHQHGHAHPQCAAHQVQRASRSGSS